MLCPPLCRLPLEMLWGDLWRAFMCCQPAPPPAMGVADTFTNGVVVGRPPPLGNHVVTLTTHPASSCAVSCLIRPFCCCACFTISFSRPLISVMAVCWALTALPANDICRVEGTRGEANLLHHRLEVVHALLLLEVEDVVQDLQAVVIGGRHHLGVAAEDLVWVEKESLDGGRHVAADVDLARGDGLAHGTRRESTCRGTPGRGEAHHSLCTWRSTNARRR